MSANPTVHVIDDDAAIRDSLSFLFAAYDMAVRTYDSAAAFLDAIDAAEPGCVVTDVRMPGIDGMELLNRVKTRSPSMPVIVITGHGDVALAVEAMKHGAADFLEKPFDDERLISAVNTAFEHWQKEEDSEAAHAEIAQRMASLSRREQDVLAGLVAGKQNKLIARDLGISPRTVEVYRANLMAKMRAASLPELVRMALIVDAID